MDQLYLWILQQASNFERLYKSSKETVEWEDGNTYPLIRVETSSDSHPFYTGKAKFTQADGRVDRFNKNTVYKKVRESVLFYACFITKKDNKTTRFLV